MENKIQWSRRELKERSKSVLHTHYWRMIFMTFLLSLLIGSNSLVMGTVQPVLKEISSDAGTNIFQRNEKSTGLTAETEQDLEDVRDELMEAKKSCGIPYLGMVTMAIIVLSFILVGSGIAINIFIANPIYVGISRFYIRSFDIKPKLREMFYPFEENYRNVVSIMFLKDLYTILWSLLFIIPGIIKSYEYYMVPYLLAENPDMRAKEAFAISRQMMQGHKWRTFVMEWSFLGWQILSAMTFGILGIFFVDSYMYLTCTALYRKLRGSDCIPQNIYFDGMEHDTVQGWYEQPR